MLFETVGGYAVLAAYAGVVDQDVQRLAKGQELPGGVPHAYEVGQIRVQVAHLAAASLSRDGDDGGLALLGGLGLRAVPPGPLGAGVATARPAS
jgi:hypothetical protein